MNKSSSTMSWDTYFMEVAKLTSLRSKDNNTKVGSVIVDQLNRIVGIGYNGFPRGINDNLFPTNRDSNKYDESKYAYVVHAEANAILNSPVYDLSNTRIYCTLFPCNECSKLLIQKGITKVIYLEDKHHDDPAYIASRRLLDLANIEYLSMKECSSQLQLSL